MGNNIHVAKQMYDIVEEGRLGDLKTALDEDIDRIHINTPFGSLLHIAAARGHLDIIQYLVEKGAPINVKGGTPGGNPIDSAASSGHLDVVKYLLRQGGGIDVSEPTKNPLFGAIYGGHTEVAKYLIEVGIDTSITYTGENMKNMDALAFAKEWGRMDIVEVLLAAHRNASSDNSDRDEVAEDE